MALAEFTPEYVDIMHKGRKLTAVRGLSLDDISFLVRTHMKELQAFYDSSQGAGFGGEAFILNALTSIPDVAFTIIAVASDEPSYYAQARRLPISIQVIALQEIARLTFEDIGGPKAFVALVQKYMDQMLAGAKATEQSSISTGNSVN